MKYLPLIATRGPLLAQVMRDVAQDPRRQRLCDCCGARIVVTPGRTEQRVRCPGCLRWQVVTAAGEVPWRLTADSAEALRRTKRWLRAV
jgi:hypothetical protein